MMKEHFTMPSSDGKTQLSCHLWRPEGEIRGIVQITHGMMEYIMRYRDFAEFLSASNFLVVGMDLLGHGHSLVESEDWGYFAAVDGNGAVLKDIHNLRELIAKDYPGIPYFMLGHSMGSYLLRQYLQDYADGLSGAVLSGTGKPPAIALSGGLAVISILKSIHGDRYRSKLVDKLALGDFNKSFEPATTTVDWLSRDPAVCKAYVEDPLIPDIFTLNAYEQMFIGIRKANDASRYRELNSQFPLLFISGTEDPVGDKGKAVRAVMKDLEKAGMRNIASHFYPGARHEVLNEINKQEVYADVLTFLTGVVTDG